MQSLAVAFQEFAEAFNKERFQPFGASSSAALLRTAIPNIFQDLVPNTELYKIYGSVGTGSWAEIPWVAILDQYITTSTQRGYYLVYLFDKNLQHIYLSLGIGYMQFEEEFGVTEARTNARAVSHYYARILNRTSENFTPGIIDLGAENNLGKGYEQAAVLAKRYVISELNDTELAEDLDAMLSLYQELKSIVGDSVLNVRLDVDADIYDSNVEDFQKRITARTHSSLNEHIIDELLRETRTYPRQVREKLVRQIVRNRKIANLIKEKSSYICSICGRAPFMQKNGQPYAEADHIVPIGQKTMGPDSVKNLRCVCAQCHAVITYGSPAEMAKLFNQA